MGGQRRPTVVSGTRPSRRCTRSLLASFWAHLCHASDQKISVGMPAARAHEPCNACRSRSQPARTHLVSATPGRPEGDETRQCPERRRRIVRIRHSAAGDQGPDVCARMPPQQCNEAPALPRVAWPIFRPFVVAVDGARAGLLPAWLRRAEGAAPAVIFSLGLRARRSTSAVMAGGWRCAPTSAVGRLRHEHCLDHAGLIPAST